MSELINKIVKCKTNDWGIWDPVPNALEWCTDGPMSTAASLVAISNKSYVEQNPPIYITDSETELGKCNEWKKKPSMPHKHPLEELATTVPSYSSGDTKFRFIIIPAGPPGSGKSVMNLNIKKRAKRINYRAFNKLWNKIGHDDVICRDPIFIEELNKLSDTIKSKEYNHQDIYKNINEHGEWYDLMITQNELYRQAKSWSATTMSKQQKRDFAKNIASFLYDTISSSKRLNNLYNNKLVEILTHIGKDTKQYNKNAYLQLNEFLFNIMPNEELKKMSEAFNIPEVTTNVDIFNAISKEINPMVKPPIHNLYGYPCFDNDVLVYLVTTFSILFGINFTYETTLNKTESLQFLFETCTYLTNKCEKYNYIFLLGFPVVNFENLIKRVIERYLKWHNDRNICSVGLPLIDIKNYFTKMSSAYLNIASYIYNCKTTEQCNGVGIDYIFLFDNNGEIPKDSYDMIRTSERALIITPESAKDKKIALSYKKTVIAILMKALNCFKKATSFYMQSTGILTNCGDGECKGASCEGEEDEDDFLPSSQELEYSSQDIDLDEDSPNYMIETIEKHQNKLQKAIQEQEEENIEDLLEACIHRMKELLPHLSNKEIKKQCLVSQKRILEISNIKDSGDAITDESRTISATGSRKKIRGKKKRKTRKHKNK